MATEMSAPTCRRSTPEPEWAIRAAPRSPMTRHPSPRSSAAALGAAALSLWLSGCVGTTATGPSWPPTAKKWFDRGELSYRTGDIDDAQIAVDNALRMLPNEPQVKVLAARVALARLEYDRVLQFLRGIESDEARSLRARALWYAGRVEQTADELEKLLANPEVRDVWATEVAKLARRGSGRKPFRMTGGLLAVSEMPQVAASSLVVPLEINGEPGLGLIATGTAEAVVDGGGEPTWLSLRFGQRVEVKDVPALSKDLSGISRQLNAPIKMLIGVNLLRHLHPTFDFTGGQFVVRSFEPPPPPAATTLRVSYVRGGGMLLRGAFGSEQTAPMASLLVDTSMSFPIALDDGGWKKAGFKLNSLRTFPNGGSLKTGTLSVLRLGAFEVPQVPGVYGAPVAQLEKGLDVELDGLVGSGLLAAFRVTLVDGGRTMWLEDIPQEAIAPRQAPATQSIPDVPDSEAAPEEEEPEEEPAKKTPGKKPPAKPAPKANPKAPAEPKAQSKTEPAPSGR